MAALAFSAALLGACTASAPPEPAPAPSSVDQSPSSSSPPSATPTRAPAPGLDRRPASHAAREFAAAARRGARAHCGVHVVRRHLPRRNHRPARSFTISGVLNVPTGRGPFPAVVLAHGYIDPAIYVRGQGMTRERGVFASRGYVALHVDYRGHAESTTTRGRTADLRLGYSADVIAAVKALRASPDVPVDDDRIALMGRSMGGGVVMKALIAEPGLVRPASPVGLGVVAGGRELRPLHPPRRRLESRGDRARARPARGPSCLLARSLRPALPDRRSPSRC